ncbi:hypothetical protein NQ318_003841 [Aromia moschata]|uniref:Cytochrome b561 domain-containing protein n=1 Tax=Aromia moschata TaxID=1265417 RepID=A0AAV8Z7M8_9CUCU|nr:hypothetical protein NQ318_003841 [Aromia moschata]
MTAMADTKSAPQLGIQLLNSSIVDGAIYCKVRRDPVTNVNGVTFDLITDKYNLLIAAGGAVDANTVQYHDVAFLASGDKQALSDVSPLAAASKLLIRLHGSFMLIAWIGTASVGILLARYYRRTWVGSSLMGKDIWFATGLGRTTLTLFWDALRPFCVFFQPIGAYFRPHPGTPKRFIFNWAHWLVGNSAHIVGIVAIFFAVKLTKAELPGFVDWILVAYVAVHVITHLLLSVMWCASEKSSDSRVTSFPMKDLGGSGRNSAYADRSADAPVSKIFVF